jgi:Golgi phosphoprotein 3
MLSLYEELLLLSVDDDKGVVLPSTGKALSYGLAGAVLAELALQNKVRVNDKRRLEVTDTAPTGDKFLDKILQEIQTSDKARKISFWVDSLNTRSKKIRKRVEGSLAEKGFIGQEEAQIIDAGSSPVDVQPSFPSKYEIKENLRAIILADRNGDLRSLALLSAARASSLLYLIFTKDERRYARRCIREKIIREALGKPTAQTIEEIEEAVSSAFSDSRG